MRDVTVRGGETAIEDAIKRLDVLRAQGGDE
jgi:hypothetical protein